MRKTLVLNPYGAVDWERAVRAKTNLHCHTTIVHGHLAGHEVVDTYHRSGYTVLAISEHQRTVYPWTDFTSWDETWENRDPASLGMIDVQGIEAGNHSHHRGMYFTGEAMPYSYNDLMDRSFEFAQDRGGLVVFNHPGRYWDFFKTDYVPGEEYSPEWYLNFLRSYDCIIGMEVVNGADRYIYDRILWDLILVELMPDRPVWGFGGDDMHSAPQAGLSYMTLYLPRLSHANVKAALERGWFTFSNQRIKVDPNRAFPATAPVVTRVEVDEQAQTIRIEARNYQTIRWYSGVEGEGVRRRSIVVGEGEVFYYRYLEGSYVRAEIYNAQGTTYTQPFGFVGQGKRPMSDPDRIVPPLVPLM